MQPSNRPPTCLTASHPSSALSLLCPVPRFPLPQRPTPPHPVAPVSVAPLSIHPQSPSPLDYGYGLNHGKAGGSYASYTRG